MNNDLKFYGNYRGIVTDNSGELGQVKIYVYGVYPEEFLDISKYLPWAEPAQPLFGGNFTNNDDGVNVETGVAGWPKVGAFVWVFFECGDFNKPIYFAACQAGEGWISEHNNQWVIKTNNVKIRIDEKPYSEASTCKFDTYNIKCTNSSIKESMIQVPTTLDIEVYGNVNININGNVNMKITGNVFEEINGNKHETIIGNVFKKHVGDLHEVHEGSTTIEKIGDTMIKVDGDTLENITGEIVTNVNGNIYENVSDVKMLNVSDQYIETLSNKSIKIANYKDESIGGDFLQVIGGDNETVVEGQKIETVVKNSITNVRGVCSLTSQSEIIEKAPFIRLN